MPSISKKGAQMPSSPIRKLVPFAEAAKKRGTNVIHLNIGQPDIKTPKVAIEALKNADIDVIAYSQTEGSEQYRSKIAGYYAKLGIQIDATNIIVTTGGSEALSITLGSILDEGDDIIIAEPFYANYNGFAGANGVDVKTVVSKIDDNFALPPIEEFEKLIGPKTKAILICNPNNPTGYLYSLSEIEQLAALAIKYDLFFIGDEVYREFAYDGRNHHSLLTLKGLEEYVVVIDSVSKRYSMCGARIGCLITRNKEVVQTTLKFAQARLSPPTLAQIASEAAIDTPQSYFDEVKAEYQLRRDFLVTELNKIEGVKVAKPSGAFYCIAELPLDNAEAFAQWLLENFQINGETVMVAPAAGFYGSNDLGHKQIRIAYVLEQEKLQKAVEILAQGLKKYPN